MCRSRRELSNEYLLPKFGFDTAENEPCKVCPPSAYRSPRCSEAAKGKGMLAVERAARRAWRGLPRDRVWFGPGHGGHRASLPPPAGTAELASVVACCRKPPRTISLLNYSVRARDVSSASSIYRGLLFSSWFHSTFPRSITTKFEAK